MIVDMLTTWIAHCHFSEELSYDLERMNLPPQTKKKNSFEKVKSYII